MSLPGRSERLPGARPALVLLGLAPIGAVAAWIITSWQVARDDNCSGSATHASCGITPESAAAVVGISALLTAAIAWLVGWWPTRNRESARPATAAWILVGAWLVLAGTYLALPPSG